MSEEIIKTGDKGNTGEPVTIAKEDHDKIVADNNSLKEKNSAVEKELIAAKSELLDPEYISYMENKSKTKEDIIAGGDDLEKLSRKEFVNFLEKGLKSYLNDFTTKNLHPVKVSIQELIAREEVRRCEKIYSDFEEYRQDMIAVVRKDEGINIEQAYKIAKANRKIDKDDTERKTAADAAAEKPGGISGGAAEPKDFKSKEAASDDAWDSVMGNKDRL